MLKNKKKIMLMLFIYILIFSINLSFANKTFVDNITFSGEKIFFDSKPFIENGNTLVPMRPFLEAAGAKVSWNQKENKVVAIKNDKIIELIINDDFIYVNGEKKKMNVKAQIYKGRTYIPLRIVAENLDSQVVWSKEKGTDIRPNTDFLKKNPPKNLKEFINIQTGQKIILGDSLENLKKVMGEPNRIDTDMNGHSWYIYNNTDNTYRNYIQIKLIDNKVSGLSTQSKNWVSYKNLHTQIKADKNLISTLQADYNNLGYNLIVFNNNENNTIQLLEVEDMNYDSYYNYYPSKLVKLKDEVIESLENQVFDHTNAYRVINGLRPLKRKSNIDVFAKKHSDIMAKQGKVTHNFPGLVDAQKKLNAFGKDNKYNKIGEVLAGGAISGGKIVNLWSNSKTHRDAILSDFKYTGIAVTYDRKSPHAFYTTQNLAK